MPTASLDDIVERSPGGNRTASLDDIVSVESEPANLAAGS